MALSAANKKVAFRVDCNIPAYWYNAGVRDVFRFSNDFGQFFQDDDVEELVKHFHYPDNYLTPYNVSTVSFPSASLRRSLSWREKPKLRKSYFQGMLEQIAIQQDISDIYHSVNLINKTEPLSKIKEETKPMPAKNRTIKAALHGTKAAAAGEAADNAVKALERAVGTSYPEVLKTPFGRQIAKFLLSTAVLEVHTRAPGTLPVSEGLANACELVIDESARQTIAPLLKKLTPALKRLAKAGVELQKVAGDVEE